MSIVLSNRYLRPAVFILVLPDHRWLSSRSADGCGALVSEPHDRGQAVGCGRLYVPDAVLGRDTISEIVRFWLSGFGFLDQAQLNSVSDCQSLWSRAASFLATATLARFGPLLVARRLPQSCNAHGRFSRARTLFAAS